MKNEIDNTNMIHIHAPFKEEKDGYARLCVNVDETLGANHVIKQLWVEVDAEYGQYLVTEVCDGFLISLLCYAMRNKAKIKCDSPVSGELLHNLSMTLIPTLVSTDKRLDSIKIEATPGYGLYDVGKGVCTGLSCGVDSLDIVADYINYPDKEYKITHFCINDVGAFSVYDHHKREQVRNNIYGRARNLSRELKLPLVETHSNLQEVFPQSQSTCHSFIAMLVPFVLSKLWGKYIYASGGEGAKTYTLLNNSVHDSQDYEGIILFPCFSTSGLKIISGSMSKLRIDKIENITKYPELRKSVHSCLKEDLNCSICDKCIRNLVSFDILNVLDLYQSAYDIQLYKKYVEYYYYYIIKRKASPFFDVLFEKMSKKNGMLFDQMDNAYTEYTSALAQYEGGKYEKSFEICCLCVKKPYVWPDLYYLLGKMFRDGLGTKSDSGKAQQYMSLAEKWFGSAPPMEWAKSKDLEILWEMRTSPTYEKMVDLAKTYSKTNGNAMIYLGRAYRFGKGVEKNLLTSADWFRKAINRMGLKWAVLELCDVLYEISSPDSLKEMINLLEKEINGKYKGGAKARLARAYRDGKGVEMNLEKALALYDEAITLGVKWAESEKTALQP